MSGRLRRLGYSLWLGVIAWGVLVLPLAAKFPLVREVPAWLVYKVQAWLGAILCGAGQHLQGFHRCVGPGAPADRGTVVVGVFGLLYVVSVLAVYWLLVLVWKIRLRARPAMRAVVGNFATSPAQPSPSTDSSIEDPFGEPADDESVASRCFEAFPPMLGSAASGWTLTRALILMGGLGVVMFAGLALLNTSPHEQTRQDVGQVLVIIPLVVFFLGFGVYRWWYEDRKVLVNVTSDGLTVDQRPGDVFSSTNAKLGPWRFGGTAGTALHLQCGPHQFVLGGRDHRIATRTRLEAPPVDNVDAWMPAQDFDELLAIFGRQNRRDVRPPAPGEPIRCLLFCNADLLHNTWRRGFRDSRRYYRSVGQPQLAIDVGPDAIRIIDPNTNEQVASASCAQVTAAPETYIRRQGLRVYAKSPVLVVDVPGWQTLTIGCHERTGSTGMGGLRFSWRGEMPQRVNDPAVYTVTGRDWLTLVEKCGLASYLDTDVKQL